jgi:transposase
VRERQSYSDEFKDAIRLKILNRNGKSMHEVCEEEGVKYSTAFNWVHGRVKTGDMKKQKSTGKFSAEQKLKILIDTGALTEAELGVYLRTQGLYAAQLIEWKKDFLSSRAEPKRMNAKKDTRDQKIKALEKNLRRKDKALAEASALLILQKKVNLIWGESDEDDE